MTLMCQTPRLGPSQLLSILQPHQHFLRRRRPVSWPETSAVGKLSFPVLAGSKLPPRCVIVSRKTFAFKTIRRHQYEIYLKHDFKGCAANKSETWHLLYIMCYLVPYRDIKLQQQYEDELQVSPWLNFSLCSFKVPYLLGNLPPECSWGGDWVWSWMLR